MTETISVTQLLATQEETEKLARMLSLWVRPGFVILLKGDLGSGKSTFARAFIRSLATNLPELEVPSPSFALLNTYDMTRIPVAHADLYRLDQAAAVEELGLAELCADHAVLVEWPELLDEPLSPHNLVISLSGSGEVRTAHMQFSGGWLEAWQRNGVIADFLSTTPWASGTRTFFEGDASSRRYERLSGCGEDCLLMDMPQRPDGPPVRDGLPYSAIAHLAEGIASVIGINNHLVELGYSAPRILSHDIGHGLAIMENLGSQVYGKMRSAGLDMREPMLAAVDVLADMAARTWPTSISVAKDRTLQLFAYDARAMLIEVDLILSWFYPHVRQSKADTELHQSFAALWQELFGLAETSKPVWVMRDYHSPNLMWLPERAGLQRVGIIDSQDALLGHPAYDLVSMLQDARLDIPGDEAAALYQHYEERRIAGGQFDRAGFSAAYALLGAQRATKILGIFARLSKRDGKHVYLKHIPRVSRYLRQNLQHPALQPLKIWYEAHLIEALGPGGP